MNKFTVKSMVLIMQFLVFATLFVPKASGQVTFSQRTSPKANNTKVYNLQGDFQMIGNTNLTLSSYGNTSNNSNTSMIYVDMDGNPNTVNSSSATLEFSDENGALEECTKIIYAGLYWTGRSSTSEQTITVSGTTQTVGTITDTTTLSNLNQIPETSSNNRTMTITRSGSSGEYIVTYQFYYNKINNTRYYYYFEALYDNEDGSPLVRYRTRSGNYTYTDYIYINDVSISDNGNIRTITFDPVTIYTTSTKAVTVGGLIRDKRGDLPSYTNTSKAIVYTANYNTIGSSKTLYKNKVLLKHEDASAYSTITADDNNYSENIYYPTTSYDELFAGYQDVTEYVKYYGTGKYTVADVALITGNGGDVGYSGGWGMVVVYELST